MGKLVRDKIPEIIRRNGEEPVIRRLLLGEFRPEILRKMIEEAGEVLQAINDRASLVGEFADVKEVYEEALLAHRITAEEVHQARRKKNRTNGRFKMRFYLESTKKLGQP